ncbi:MAG: heavy metal-binding domain-containing protein [Acidimicrobiales bacterium]
MTNPWDGRGLPPAATARMARGAEGGPGASLFGISGQAALEACGFSVVGEVMGCIVEHIGFQGYAGCGWVPSNYGNLGGFPQRYGAGPVATRTASQGFGAYTPYVDALYHGYDTAILRMLLECRDLRGDGVVGVTLKQTHMGEGNREFLVYGTAVRAHAKQRPANIFSTLLPAHDVAKLLHRGWVPAGITLGIALAIRHDDFFTRQQASAWSGNTEVSGFTELVHRVRQDARQQFSRRVKAFGADGGILSDMTLDIWEVEPAEQHRDHVALASVLGTSVARFGGGGRDPSTASLSILSLADKTVSTIGRKS